MKRLKLILLLLIIIITPGCWNYRVIENLGIVGAIGIDTDKDGFVVSVEVINPKKVGGSSTSGGKPSEETDVVVYKAKAKTVKEAINKMVLESPKPMYVGHVNLLVIGEEAAKKGIKEFMDYFLRDTESRKVFTTVIVKGGKAEDAIKILQPLEPITANNIQSSFEATSQTYGNVSDFSFDEIIMGLYTQGRNPTIAAIKIYGSAENGEKNENLSSTESDTTIKIVGTGVLKEDKLIDYLDVKEGIYYSLLRNKTNSITLSFQCDKNNNYGNVVIDTAKSDVKVKIKNNKPVVSVNITGTSSLNGYNCKTNLRDEKNIDKIEVMVEKEMIKNVKKVIKKVQSIDSDIFGFGEYLYRNNNSYWKKNKNNWDKIFPEIKYSIKANISIERVGSTVDAAKSR